MEYLQTTFSKTVNKLEAAEPAIKQVVATARSIADLNMKSNGGGNAEKCNSSGNEKAPGEKKLCPCCHKKHAGKYQSKKGGPDGANGNQPSSFSKKQNDHIRSMIAQANKKSHKFKDSDNDYDGDNIVEWT